MSPLDLMLLEESSHKNQEAKCSDQPHWESNPFVVGLIPVNF